MRKVLIRTDASNSIGMGHINRCVSLSLHLKAEGMDTLFVLNYESDIILENYINSGLNIVMLCTCSLNEEALFLVEHLSSKYSSIVFDFSHYQNMERIKDFVPYFELLNCSFNTFLIDGFNDTAIIKYINPEVDVVITPYIGAEDHSNRSKVYKHWVGPSYFIFSIEYTLEEWKRYVPSIAENLLVTMGGSDPYEMTLVVLDALKLISLKIHCRIIIGSGFSVSLIEKIKNQCFSLPLCEIVEKPKNLVTHLKWADMAISASGLTKYEMALTGVPSLQMSFNKDLAKITANQEKEGFYRDLGLYIERTSEEIVNEIEDLAKKSDYRENMIKKGQALFQKSGIKRFVKYVRDI
ncbi:MAG: hypothetical protein GY760_09070 [Deltaproteobacteria bacterium]|nr:hypothetical protein [Deltaproteobacteria bacterium]